MKHSATLKTMNNDLEELAAILAELELRQAGNKIKSFFRSRNDGYTKHWAFFDAGSKYRQRLLMAANRVGKSFAGGCELVYHATGVYPPDWKGKRFPCANDWWIVSDTDETSRQIIQLLLLGPVGAFGTGLIPRDALDFDSLKDAVKADTRVKAIRVRHITGGFSTISLKSSEQGRKAFQGTEVNVWIDEECPMDVYQECLMRTMTNDRIMILTFTPLKGLSDVVMSFLEEGDVNSEGETGVGKYVVRATWDDAPHLTEKAKQELLASIPPHQRDARSKGIPMLGAGAVFPISEDQYVVQPFDIPKHWPRAFGMDVGSKTAAAWIAHDRESDVIYMYSEHYLEDALPSSHAQSILARGKWIKGVIDTSSHGDSQTDHRNLFDMYISLGLTVQNADKAVEAGIYEMWERFTSGRLKVFSTCTKFLEEIRIYRRDEKGRIVKKADHLIDSLRYAVFNKDVVLSTEPSARPQQSHYHRKTFSG